MKFVYVILGVAIGISCNTVPSFKRAWQERVYRPCKDHEHESPVGKFCYRKCTKYRAFKKRISLNCVRWKYSKKDFNDPETFKAFRDAGFVFGKEG